MLWSEFSVATPELDRLIQIGAPGYADELSRTEAALGVALWQVIDLVRWAAGEDPELDDNDDRFDTLHSREAPIGPRASAELVFRAFAMPEDTPKEAWMLHVWEVDLLINVFARDLPHRDDPTDQSRLVIRPKRGQAAYSQPAANRDAPYMLVVRMSEGEDEVIPLPAPDVEVAVAILGKIAAKYSKG